VVVEWVDFFEQDVCPPVVKVHWFWNRPQCPSPFWIRFYEAMVYVEKRYDVDCVLLVLRALFF
jgi:hypothetical protein